MKTTHQNEIREESHDRLRLVVIYLIRKGAAKTQTELGPMIGFVNNSHFSQVLNGKRSISKERLRKIKQLAPEVNIDWIMSGIGSMILKDAVRSIDNNEYVWVEYVDLETTAGHIGGNNPAILPENKRMLLPSEYDSGKYLVVKVVGRSMENGIYSIHDGSHVLIKEVENFDLKKNMLPLINNLYVIVSKDGTVLKQIIEQNVNEEYIMCRSFNPEYKDYKIPFEDIIQIFLYRKVVSVRTPIPSIQ